MIKLDYPQIKECTMYEPLNIDEKLIEKADSYKKELIHEKVYAKRTVEIVKDESAFQALAVKDVADASLPITLAPGASVILDFGTHLVGYLNYSLIRHGAGHIDSPIMLKFSFGEFPLEIVTPSEEYKGRLGSGWLQNETRSAVFMPYSSSLERRYSFRFLKIERVDTAATTVDISELYVDAVSAVRMEELERIDIPDPELKRIYDISVKTLAECEQDVFEDGPKRDRRLWIGDLRLQALTDYHTFRNLDLVKRCIYLFAACRTSEGLVAPCVFPNDPPYIGEWSFLDYSLFIIPCLYDYITFSCDGFDLVRELYPIALNQAKMVSALLNENGEVADRVVLNEDLYFIDWCPGLDKEVAFLGVYAYVLAELLDIAFILGEDREWIARELDRAKKWLLSHYSEDNGLFVTSKGQISPHSQVWVVLSGALSRENSRELLTNMNNAKLEIVMHTPYMMHYYIEALFTAGMKEEAMDFIRSYYGRIVAAGFDTCPEIFNPGNEFESPYGAPEINSACHAWSCTPAYWIKRYYSKEFDF